MNAIDLATKLNATTATNLFKNGIRYVGRYLGHSWKGLEVAEVTAIKAAGLQIFSLFEKASTNVSYFTAAQGKADALEAYSLAKELGQPEGTAIYFTVDFEAQTKDFDEILTYFQAVKANLKGYKLGAYGCYSVLQFLQPKNIASYYFQTVAWSHGQHCNFNNIFQFQCDKDFAGLKVDFVNLEKSDIGAWGQAAQPQVASHPIIAQVKVIAKALNVRQGPGPQYPIISVVKYGQIYNVTGNLNDWHEIILDSKTKGYAYGNNGTYLELIRGK